MYLNEKAWEIQQDDHYVIHRALKNFMQIYSILAGEFHKPGIFVPAGTEIYLRSSDYPVRSGYRIQKIVPFFLGKAYSLSAGRRM